MLTKAKRAKPLTVKEKKWRAETRAEYRAKGLLPPVKKPLNRKKFITEARDEFNSADFGLSASRYIIRAMGFLMGDYRPTLQDVGIAKVLKAACEIAKFEKELEVQGRTEYKLTELYERLKPIINA